MRSFKLSTVVALCLILSLPALAESPAPAIEDVSIWQQVETFFSELWLEIFPEDEPPVGERETFGWPEPGG